MTKPIGPFGRLARFVLANRLPVSLLSVVVVLCAALWGLPPQVDANMLSLLPDDDPASLALKELDAQEGGLSLLTITVRADAPEDLPPYLDRLAAELSALPSIQFALHELAPETAARVGMLQLRSEDVRELTGRMQGALMLGPAMNPIVASRLMDMGPVTERIAAASEADPFGDTAENRGRLLAKPTHSSHDQVFATALMEDLNAILDRLEQQTTGVEVEWVGGAYRHSVEDRVGIQRDLWWTSLASLVMVFLVIGLSFRSLRATFIVMVPLIAANVLNLSLASAFLGTLNTYTSFGTAILVGLGIDFAVHLFGRYRELRHTGLEQEAAIIAAWDRTGPPCATAAVTTAASFLALMAASFRGFSELGLLLAAGLLFCLVAMLVALPILIVAFDRSTLPLFGTRAPTDRVSRSTYRFAPLGLVVVLLLTATVGVFKLPQIGWEFDLSVLRRGGLSYAELDAGERELAHASFSPIVVSYPTEEALAEGHRRVEAQIQEGSLQYVGRALSMQSLLPSDQAERLGALRDLQGLLDHANLRYLPPPLVEQLLPLRGADLSALHRDDFPAGILDMVGGARQDQHRLMLFPKGNMWDLREAAALSDEIAATFPGVPVAGEYLAMGSLYRTLMRDMPLIAGLALLMVTLLTALDLRRVWGVVAVVGTLVVGLIWAGTAVQMVGIKLSMVNVVGVPILVGLGVDVAIHLLHRLREEGPGSIRLALTTTGVAASVSIFTTATSFLSLTLAGNRGVQALGLLVVVGLFTMFLVGALVLPLVWATLWRLTGRAPGARTLRPEPPSDPTHLDRVEATLGTEGSPGLQ